MSIKSFLIDNDSVIKGGAKGGSREIFQKCDTTQYVEGEHLAVLGRNLSVSVCNMPDGVVEAVGTSYTPMGNIEYAWNGGGDAHLLNGNWYDLDDMTMTSKIKKELEDFSKIFWKCGNEFHIGAILKDKKGQFFACRKRTVRKKGNFSLFMASVNGSCRPIITETKKFKKDLQANGISNFSIFDLLYSSSSSY